jgi:anti-sigma regulatory factor (Ser/Thr protein kinase)
MESDRARSADEPVRSADARRDELDRLRIQLRRQATVIATLSEAVSNFHRGLKALRAENGELRAESDELRDRLVALSRSGFRSDDELVELAIAAGPHAPAIARRAISAALAERVAAPALANAQLLASELVTNSVRHSGMPAGDELVVRLRIWNDRCRVEVEDPGRDGVIAPQSPDPIEAGGMGLNVVQTLSERWGLVRAVDGPTRVWAQVKCCADPAPTAPPRLTLV